MSCFRSGPCYTYYLLTFFLGASLPRFCPRTSIKQLQTTHRLAGYPMSIFFDCSFFSKMFSILYVCCGDWPHSKVKENLLTHKISLAVAKTESACQWNQRLMPFLHNSVFRRALAYASGCYSVPSRYE